MARSSRRSPDLPAQPNVRAITRRPKRNSFWQRARDMLLDSLREHPIFDLDDAPTSSERAGVVEAAQLDESQRELIYEEQWLWCRVVRRALKVRARLSRRDADGLIRHARDLIFLKSKSRNQLSGKLNLTTPSSMTTG